MGSGALRGGAAGGRAFWGAQIVHQRQAVLPTEVNKFDLSDTAVEVDTWKGKESKAVFKTTTQWFVVKPACSTEMNKPAMISNAPASS